MFINQREKLTLDQESLRAFFHASLQLVSLTFIHRIVIYPVDSAIHWINHYPVDNAIGFLNTYPLDSDLSGG